MPGVTELVDAAIARGKKIEAEWDCAPSTKRDLTRYIMDIATEADHKHHSEWFSDPVIAAALFRIWTGEGTE